MDIKDISRIPRMTVVQRDKLMELEVGTKRSHPTLEGTFQLWDGKEWTDYKDPIWINLNSQGSGVMSLENEISKVCLSLAEKVSTLEQKVDKIISLILPFNGTGIES